MLAIKLRPIGKKKQISYRIVVGEKRSKLDGKSLEDIGWYNPHTDKFLIKKDRVEHWIKSGAIPTDSVHNILIKAKALEGKKIPVHKKSKHEPVAKQEPIVEKSIKSTPELVETSTTEETPIENQITE